jgi:hypothetical protein
MKNTAHRCASQDATSTHTSKISKLSNYIGHIDDLERGQRIVLVARVSDRKQKDHLEGSLKLLRRECRARELVVVKEYVKIGSGKADVESDFKIEVAAAIARKWRAVILAESVDRLRRPSTFHRNINPYVRLTLDEIQRLMKDANGVKLYTLLHPDTSPSKVKAYQSNRGKKPKKNRKERKEKYVSYIMKLHEKGYSTRKISERIWLKFGEEISHMTIHNWTHK